jgi:hypothetical protein
MRNKSFKKWFYEEPKTHQAHKWYHTFDIYERHFEKYVGTNPVILEIGVEFGGGIEMLNYYFDNQCTIYGIDFNPVWEKYNDHWDNVKMFIGDTSTNKIYEKVTSEVPVFDIVIDDGSHINDHQIRAFEHFYPRISDGGVYLCEDVCTSYWSEHGGGMHGNTFIEHSKKLIDKLNSYHHREPSATEDDINFRKTTNSIHYYDNFVFIEKMFDDEEPQFGLSPMPQ